MNPASLMHLVRVILIKKTISASMSVFPETLEKEPCWLCGWLWLGHCSIQKKKKAWVKYTLDFAD